MSEKRTWTADHAIIGFMTGDALFIHAPQPIRSIEVSRNRLFDALPGPAREKIAHGLRNDPALRHV